MKRFLAIVLCLIMVFSLSATAFAEEHSHTITIYNNQNKDYVYAAYQIFDGDLNTDGVLSNIAWGSGVDGAALLAELQGVAAYSSCTDAKSVAAVLAAAPLKMDDPVAMAFADIVAKHVISGAGKASSYDNEAKHHVITGLEDGYYIVINETISSEPNSTYSRYILEVVRDTEVSHKGEFPTVDKKIDEGGNKVELNEAGIGEAVKYEITGTLPENLDDYVTYYYAFRDTLSAGLTYNDDVRITVNGVDVTKYFYKEGVAYSGTDPADPYKGGTSLYFGIQDLLALELLADPVVGEITSKTLVVVTYSATVNENAVIGVEGNPNKVRIEYDNNPNTEEVPATPPDIPEKPVPTEPPTETPEDEVESYVTSLTVKKVDGAGNILTGAEFTLSGDAVRTMLVTRKTFAVATGSEVPVYWELVAGGFTDVAPVLEDDPATTDIDEKTIHLYVTAYPTHVIKEVKEVITKTESVEVKAFVGEDGLVTFTGLCAGDYVLTESVTPAGYNTIDPIEFTITFHPDNKEFISSNSWILEDQTTNTFYATIVNVAGSTLPSTGGIGTTIFYILGGILVAGSLVFLVTKKRMGA